MAYNQQDNKDPLMGQGYPHVGPGYPHGGPGYPPSGPGYPSAPMGGGDGPGYPMPQPQGPPPGYSYPPVPVPYTPDNGGHGGAITSQPGPGQGGFYPIVPPMDQGYGGPPQSYGFGGPPGGGYPPVGDGQVNMQFSQPHMQQQYPPPQMQQPQYSQPPIQMQPTSGYGQTVPLNVPPGLEYLTQLDRLFVKQKVELLEAFTGCETNNKYKIKDSQGRELFKAKEDTDCCTRQCCGPYRPFDLKIKDTQDREVIHLSRSLACDSCWCPCWLQSIEVYAPPGQLAGTVEQDWSICVPKFTIKDAQGNAVLKIEGPLCTFSLCGSVEFQIMSKDGSTQVGKISKNWSGLAREVFTDSDNFGINFPMDLDVKMKAVMLGACFLIDFMFFEKSRNQEQDGPGMF